MMTSATWPRSVRRLARKYMRNPLQIYVGTMDLQACRDVEQRIEFLDETDRKARLIHFLSNEIDPHNDKVSLI